MPNKTMKEICAAIEAGALNALLQTKPHLLRRADSLGDLPLHAACSSRYQSTSALHSRETIETLARHYPEALGTPNAHGMLPLHLACWFTETSLCRRLMELHPPALRTSDENGYLPISFLIGKMAMSNESWDDVKELFEYLLTQAPDTLWQVDKQGILPLQYANCNGGVGERLLQLYLQISEEGMKRATNAETQQTPIHVALCSNTRLDIIERIHQADPQAIEIPDAQGRLALHHIIADKFVPHAKVYNRNKLEWLLQEAHPQAILRQDHEGKTPLHHLLENQSLFYKKDDPPKKKPMPSSWSSETGNPQAFHFLSLLLANPRDQTGTQVDRNDWIQCASSKLASRQVCATPDRHGNLPLHLAVQQHSQEGGSPGLIPALLQHYPQAAVTKNGDGQTCVELATSLSCSLNTLYTLVNHNPHRVLQDHVHH